MDNKKIQLYRLMISVKR